MAYLARKFGVRIVYGSATRGEGGQNRIAPDKQEALGVYRSWESLATRAVDGGEASYGVPPYQFALKQPLCVYFQLGLITGSLHPLKTSAILLSMCSSFIFSLLRNNFLLGI